MSDTREEIALEKWILAHEGTCYTCKWYKKEHFPTGGGTMEYCNNPLSENEGMDIRDISECVLYREKDWAQELSQQRARTWETIKRANRKDA